MENNSSKLDRFFSSFKNPFLPSYLSGRALFGIILVAVLIQIIISVIPSLGFSAIPEGEQMKVRAIAFGISILVGLLFEFGLPYILKYNDTTWTGSMQLLNFCGYGALAGVSSLLYVSSSSSEGSVVLALFLLLALLLILGLLIVGFQSTSLATSHQSTADSINSSLGNKKFTPQSNFSSNILSFRDQRNSVSIIPNQLIYAKFENGNTTFVIQNMMGVEKTSLNVSKNQVMKELEGHSQFTSFSDNMIVNSLAIHNVTGHAGGFEIALAKVNEKIAVGRKYMSAVENI
ncbi:MAG: hypothetical protein ACRCVT_10595 [Leadbetterella sp.]